MPRFQVELDGRDWTVDQDDLPSRERLMLLSQHLLYEIEAASAMSTAALTFGRSEVLEHPRHSLDFWRSEALVAAFLLHLRALDEFFHKDLLPSARDEGTSQIRLANCLTAFDFIDPPETWIEERPPRHEELETSWGRMNRTIMHMDRRRTQDRGEHVGGQKEQTWRVGDLWQAIRPTIQAFKRSAENPRLCEGFRYRVDEALLDHSIDWDTSASAGQIES